MKLIDHWKSLDPAGRSALGKAVAAQPVYLSQIAYGHRRASPQLARRIEAATEGAVSRYELRPDVYGDAPDIAVRCVRKRLKKRGA